MATRKKTVKPEVPAITTALTPEIVEIPTDISGVPPASLAKVATDAHASSRALKELADSWIIHDSTFYLAADEELSHIRRSRQAVEALFDDEKTGLIRPIRMGLDRLYEFKRNLLKPFEYAETEFKRKMSEYKLAEKRVEDEKARVERERLAQIQRELDAQRKEDEPQFRASSMPTVAPGVVKAEHSSAAFIKKVRVVSIPQLVEAIEAGLVPEHIGWNLLQVDITVLSMWFKTDPADVESCPGLEVYEDAQIRGRR